MTEEGPQLPSWPAQLIIGGPETGHYLGIKSEELKGGLNIFKKALSYDIQSYPTSSKRQDEKESRHPARAFGNYFLYNTMEKKDGFLRHCHWESLRGHQGKEKWGNRAEPARPEYEFIGGEDYWLWSGKEKIVKRGKWETTIHYQYDLKLACSHIIKRGYCHVCKIPARGWKKDPPLHGKGPAYSVAQQGEGCAANDRSLEGGSEERVESFYFRCTKWWSVQAPGAETGKTGRRERPYILMYAGRSGGKCKVLIELRVNLRKTR